MVQRGSSAADTGETSPEANQCIPQIAGDITKGTSQEIVRLNMLMESHLSQIASVMHRQATKTLASACRSEHELR